MTFSDKQVEELRKPLDKKNVKPPAPGKYGDYVEGWHVIAEANRIFGFDAWTRETVSMTETNRDLVATNKGDQWRVGYVAKVRVTVGETVREGTGFGSGMGKPDALGDAIESAVKEAETDAMKRALMTFGNPFGLALYDKTQANVSSPERDNLRQSYEAKIDAAAGKEVLQAIWQEMQNVPEAQLSQQTMEALAERINKRLADMKEKAA